MPALGAEIGLPLALDSGDEGGIERVAFVPVPPLAEAPIRPLRLGGPLHRVTKSGSGGRVGRSRLFACAERAEGDRRGHPKLEPDVTWIIRALGRDAQEGQRRLLEHGSHELIPEPSLLIFQVSAVVQLNAH